MGCLCNTKQTSSSCTVCNPCDASFSDAFTKLKCNQTVYVPACTEAERKQNDKILAQLHDVLCRLKGSICPSDSYINLATQYQFFDNLINDDFIIADEIIFTNLTYKNIRVFLNGQRIYHIDEQVDSGVYCYDFNANTGKISIYQGYNGPTDSQGDAIAVGDVEVPAYISVEADRLIKFSDLLKCS